MAEFLSMGQYGTFVWGSYGVCFGLLALLTALSVRGMRARRRELDALEGSRARRGRGAEARSETETA